MAHFSGSLCRFSGRFNSAVLEKLGFVGSHPASTVLQPRCNLHQGEKTDSAASGGNKKITSDFVDSARRRGNQTNKRWLHYKQTDNDASPASIRERNKTVTSYYNQTAIDKAAEKVNDLQPHLKSPMFKILYD